ncbi:MAG: SDR family oxidoreductase [Cyclobacteriaceae bacterium]
MKILLTGATGYIGQRLLPTLVGAGHTVVCCVRDRKRFNPSESLIDKIEIVEADLLDKQSLSNIPQDIDAAYYLVHSMSASSDYEELEKKSAKNFTRAINDTQAKQVIYLSGIVNDKTLSKHLTSRKNVERELAKGKYHLTTLRAGIIIGSGSASFEIIRDLVEKLPVMVAPRWLKTKCQPIGIADVISFLFKSLNHPKTFDKSFDIGGPDVLNYQQMLMGYARVRKLRRKILIVPVMTPRLSSYWLYFVTSTSYKLATALVDSMKIEVICEKSNINSILDIQPIGYEEALTRTLSKVENQEILSSWKDSLISGRLNINISDFLNVPTHGCFKDCRTLPIGDKEATLDRIWRIGGQNGWYYATWLWKIRGFLDKLVGGVGLRRGRTHDKLLQAGDAVDFWRVLFADRNDGRVLLFAEMRLPGEAWLEFKVRENQLTQTATFRPRGIWGRLYWYSVFPLHGIVFGGMIKRLANK